MLKMMIYLYMFNAIDSTNYSVLIYAINNI